MKKVIVDKIPMHFMESYLLNPTNPVTVNVIGAGSTGSRVITTLGETNHSLRALGHPGLHVNLFDGDCVTDANLAKQRFAESEIGLKKSVARINNVNSWFGTNWKAIPCHYSEQNSFRFKHYGSANIFISCVDTVESRLGIAAMIKSCKLLNFSNPYKPFYWMDYGNSQYSGQFTLATVGEIKQPTSKIYRTVEYLPSITDEFSAELASSENDDNTPSCSHREALLKQDLFINGALVQFGATLLLHLFQDYMIPYRGAFMNLKNLRTEPLSLD